MVGINNNIKALNSNDDKKHYGKIDNILNVPNLIKVQTDSFNWFKTDGLEEVFKEISPVEDSPSGRFELNFLGHKFGEPKNSEKECKKREITFAAPLHVRVELKSKSPGPQEGERKIQDLFIGDIPIMSSTGTFIINGAERVVVSQLVRSPGAYFTVNNDPSSGRILASAKLIPHRGAWMEFETSNRDVISVKVDRKRKTPVSMLLRALGYTSNEEIMALFENVDTDPEHPYIRTTIERDTSVGTHDEALLELYKRLRPGEPPSIENARTLLDNLISNPRRYSLGRVGRYKLNKRLGDKDTTESTLSAQDIIGVLQTLIEINRGEKDPDDVDHLGNRRVRAVGELLQNQVRIGLTRMERVIKERMTIEMDSAQTTPAALINIRPIVAAIKEFFGGSQLSQFMDQTNPLAELTHKRRLSALGPGGLTRERAGFDVRDVHHSHYGRICPIETPEGPNIGLLGSMATYARTNEHGFIETPYRKINNTLKNTDSNLVGRTSGQKILNTEGKVLINTGKSISKGIFTRLSKLPDQDILVAPFVSNNPDDIVYLTADEEEIVHVAQANSPLDSLGQFINSEIETRFGESVSIEVPENIKYMDVSPMQLVSVSTSLIPFLEHNDGPRALMGSNMQRQAVPLIKPEPPLVGTGMESKVARDSGQVTIAKSDGVVIQATGEQIIVESDEDEPDLYSLQKFTRSNQGTCINQRPIVNKGDLIQEGQILADSSSTANGELALGQNLLVGFMSWEGYNFEDAIIISEKLVRDDRFTSIHIEKHEIEARDTKLGPEEITRDIPNVAEDNLGNLDEMGIIRIGAEVGPADILVGKITPKGETELSAEEKLLRAIFGEKARDVKDSSLRVPHGERGKIIDVKILSKENGDSLPPGVNKLVRLWIAQTRKISVGDKMAGRHGNKGVISQILPEQDMPFLEDGTPLDIILNPIGVPSRMNLGQVLETHLGLAANDLSFRAITPVFDSAPDVAIEDALSRSWITKQAGAISKDYNNPNDNSSSTIDDEKIKSWLSKHGFDYDDVFDSKILGKARETCVKIWLDLIGVDTSNMSSEELIKHSLKLNRESQMASPNLGKSILYDGRTGEKFDQPIAVGYIYMFKLLHLVEDKIHARSTGPYSLITQQPLGGKAQFGGQRFGEMEVWALEAYSAAYNLQEILTVKSDDVVGRVKTYEAIVKGEEIVQPGIPESFHVLLKELQSLGLSIELLQSKSNSALLDIPEELSSDETHLLEGLENSLESAEESTENSAVESTENSAEESTENSAEESTENS